MSPTRRQFMQASLAAVTLPAGALTTTPAKGSAERDSKYIFDEAAYRKGLEQLKKCTREPYVIYETYHRIVTVTDSGRDTEPIVYDTSKTLSEDLSEGDPDNLCIFSTVPMLVQVLPRGSHGCDDLGRQGEEWVFSIEIAFDSTNDRDRWEKLMQGWYRKRRDGAVKPRQFKALVKQDAVKWRKWNPRFQTDEENE